jgi:putative transposase
MMGTCHVRFVGEGARATWTPVPDQGDCRSVEYKQTGWQLDAAGKRRTLTDGCGIGQVRLIGARDLATFPLEQIKRVRLLRRADGSYAQFVVAVERQITHVSSGSVVGIDVGIAA